MKTFFKLSILILPLVFLASCPSSEPLPDLYDIRFDPNGGYGFMEPQEAELNETVQLNPCTIFRYGYRFLGWGTGPSSGVKYLDGDMFTMLTKGFTLYAQWEVGVYQVWYDPGSPEATGYMAPQLITFGEYDQIRTVAYVRAGYTFAGWATYPNGDVQYWNGAAIQMYQEGITLYAIWLRDPCYISFNKGAADAYGAMADMVVSLGARVNLDLCAFERTGYDFYGWATGQGGRRVYTNGQAYDVTSTTATLWALWVPRQYSLSFDSGGGTGTMASQSLPYGVATKVNPCTFTRAGYTFAGWAASAEGTPALSDQGSYTMNDEGATLYARWSPGECQVSFSAYGGSGYMPPQAIEQGTSAPLNAVAFTRAGYDFVGWSLAPGGSFEKADGATFTMNTNGATLYAIWKNKNYYVTFNPNGGYGAMAPQLVAYDFTVKLNDNKYARTGFSFAGWSPFSSGGVRWVNRDTTFTLPSASDVTIYAIWNDLNPSPSPTSSATPPPSPSPTLSPSPTATPTPTPSGGLIIEVQ